jgi:protein-S-isoprenylcysteine O-methyltransferase Ste14
MMSPKSHKALALLKTAIFTVLVPGTVAFYVPFLLAQPHQRWFDRPQAAWQWIGLVPFLAGAGIYLSCAWDFAVTGLGTPAPIDAPRVLVVKGLYAYVRNPMYVGVLNIIFGFAIWFASRVVLTYFACVWLAFHLFVLFYEEPHLRRVFGEPYRIYCKRVHRWLPKVPAK